MFIEYLETVKPKINGHLSICLDEFKVTGDLKTLLMRGKRLRGGLLLLVHSIEEDIDPQALDLACAIELAHSSSLIFDDIIDEDKIRRGRPTLHESHGHKHAILNAIDVLSLPYSLTARYGNEYTDTLAKTQRAMARGVLKELSGLSATGVYDTIISLKTGVLFGLATRWGAIAAGMTADEIEGFYNYGLHTGKAMQIADDINDIEHGKIGFGSELILLKCLNIDRLVGEFVKDIKDRSIRLSKIRELWESEGVQKSLDSLLNAELRETEKIANYDLPIDCEEMVILAPRLIVSLMREE